MADGLLWQPLLAALMFGIRIRKTDTDIAGYVVVSTTRYWSVRAVGLPNSQFEKVVGNPFRRPQFSAERKVQL